MILLTTPADDPSLLSHFTIQQRMTQLHCRISNILRANGYSESNYAIRELLLERRRFFSAQGIEAAVSRFSLAI